jgi:hypothetical protein
VDVLQPLFLDDNLAVWMVEEEDGDVNNDPPWPPRRREKNALRVDDDARRRPPPPLVEDEDEDENGDVAADEDAGWRESTRRKIGAIFEPMNCSDRMPFPLYNNGDMNQLSILTYYFFVGFVASFEGWID